MDTSTMLRAVAMGMAAAGLAAAEPAGAQVLYVDSRASQGGDGRSWARAFRTVGEALDLALRDRSVRDVWVAEGTYTIDAPLRIDGPLRFLGGFEGTETDRAQRDPAENETTLIGAVTDGPTLRVRGAASALTAVMGGAPGGPGLAGWRCTSAISTVLDGFVMRDAVSGSVTTPGGFVLADGSEIEFARIAFRNNEGGIDPQGFSGGAVAVRGARTEFFDCLFENNRAPSKGIGFNGGSGGAVLLDRLSRSRFTRCDFLGNAAGLSRYGQDGGGGGAIAIVGSDDHRFANCTFIGNSAGDGASGGSGGAILVRDGRPVVISFENCLFYDNAAGRSFTGRGPGGEGGALSFQSGLEHPLAIQSSTFAYNRAGRGSPSGLTGGIYAPYAGMTLINSVLWGNVNGSGIAVERSQLDVRPESSLLLFSCVQGLSGMWRGAGDIGDDPRFADPQRGNVRLTRLSPCIDAGSNGLIGPDTLDMDADCDQFERLPLDLDDGPRRRDQTDVPDRGDGLAPVVDMGAYEFVCPGDVNGDGIVDTDDYFDFLNAYLAGTGRADFNRDGGVDADDVFDFLNAFYAGC